MYSRASILVALFLAACTSGEAQDEERHGGPPPPRVYVGEAQAGGIDVEHRLLGEVRALRRATLAAGASGEVRDVAVREGDHVEAGTLLVDIDRSVASAQLRSAQALSKQGVAEAEQARRNAERLTRAGTEIVAGAEIEQATARVESLEALRSSLTAEVREAQRRLGLHRVEAPFAGVVARRLVDPGDWVQPGDAAIELVDDRGVEVLCNVGADLVLRVREGQPAQIAVGDVTVPAEIRGVVRALDERTRTARLRLVPVVADEGGEPSERAAVAPAEWLLPGATVEVRLTTRREAEGAVVVPRDALVYGAVGQRVVRVVEGKAQPVPVEVVAASIDEALVRAEGLAPGDVVVTRGNERLRPDQAVNVVEDEASEPSR